MKLFRKGKLAEKLVITDGLPGCGKTMLSPIISSLDKVEMYYFAFEIEFIVRMNYLKKISNNAADTLIKMLVDYKLYNSMMSREVNFRPSDLSSVTNHYKYQNYLKRLNSPGDHLVPKKIKKEKPILHLTTHDLLNYANLFANSLKDRIFYIEVTRHPLDMVNQMYYGIKSQYNNARSIQVEYFYKNKPLPYWSKDWKKLFLKLNNINRAIFNIHHMMKKNNENRYKIKKILKKNFLTVPFENFVEKPYDYLNIITQQLGSKITKNTIKEMKKQNVPRKHFYNTLPLEIYKRVGGHLKTFNNREKDKENKYKLFMSYGASSKYLRLLEKMSNEYENFISSK